MAPRGRHHPLPPRPPQTSPSPARQGWGWFVGGGEFLEDIVTQGVTLGWVDLPLRGVREITVWGTVIKNTRPRDHRRGTVIKNTSTWAYRQVAVIKNTRPGDLRRGTDGHKGCPPTRIRFRGNETFARLYIYIYTLCEPLFLLHTTCTSCARCTICCPLARWS